MLMYEREREFKNSRASLIFKEIQLVIEQLIL